MYKKGITLILTVSMMAALLCTAGCTKQDSYEPLSGLDKNEKAVLTIAIPYETNKALNTVANAFMEKYPNIRIRLQYVEDYDHNALQLFKDNAVDMILQKDVFYTKYTEKNEATGTEIPTGTTSDDYFYNFANDREIDFSDTTPDITNNYSHVRTDSEGVESVYLYSYPLGGEIRGVFVNKTLLDH